MKAMDQNGWLKTHSYLQPLASLQEQVNATIAEIPIASPSIPEWDGYVDDFHAAIPLLHSAKVHVDLEPAEQYIASLLEKLAVSPLPYSLVADSKILKSELCRAPNVHSAAVAWLLYGAPLTTSVPGFLRYIGWKTLSLYLDPVVQAFGKWRDEEKWLRGYCPTCGALPSMAQLAGKDPGRRRLLACGCCRTRWWYKRTGCPFCDSQNHQLSVLTVEGESPLRIDHCESCSGYLKTYDGEGHESLLLADWTSVHLDIIAQDRGLKRLATSLYHL